MLIAIIILFYVLPTLQAPTWCFVLGWIAFVCSFISIGITIGKSLK